jgi:predicted DNA-binding WGR domain protein
MAFKSYGKVEIFWIVPELNRKRFYCISVEPGLFGPVLVRSWGRIGEGRLRRKEQFFSERELPEALARASRLLTKKLKKGYHFIEAGP